MSVYTHEMNWVLRTSCLGVCARRRRGEVNRAEVDIPKALFTTLASIPERNKWKRDSLVRVDVGINVTLSAAAIKSVRPRVRRLDLGVMAEHCRLVRAAKRAKPCGVARRRRRVRVEVANRIGEIAYRRRQRRGRLALLGARARSKLCALGQFHRAP